MSPSNSNAGGGAANAEVAQLLRQLQASGNLTPQQQQWVSQQLLRTTGEASTGTPSVFGTIGAAGNAITQGDPRTATARGIGAGIGLGLQALLRKRRQGQAGADSSGSTAEPNITGAGSNRLPVPVGTTSSGVPVYPAETPAPAFAPAAASAAPVPAVTRTSAAPASSPPAGPGLWTASGNSASGNLVSRNGKDWFDQTTNQPFTGPVGNVTQIGSFARGGSTRRAFAGRGAPAEDLPPAPSKPLRAILMRKPGGEPGSGGKHFPIPVISTTIVIAHHKKPKAKAKAKPAKKAAGGRIQPRKPAAVPPAKGPGNGGPPAPFARGGHVQVPRGSGCATRGRKFGGIY